MDELWTPGEEKRRTLTENVLSCNVLGLPLWTPGEEKRRTLVESGLTVVANLKTDHCLISWAQSEGLYVYIGRAVPRSRMPASDWRNPYHIGKDGDRATVIERYREYLEGRPDLLSRIEELRGKVLACWCYPDPCHGNVLIDRLKTVSVGVD